MNGCQSGKMQRRGLEEQTVLITGGSRGIGRATALRLARERPAHIVIAYCMNHEAARNTVRDVEALGVTCSAYPTDVGNEPLFRDLFSRVADKLGRLDIFISNAARASFQPLATVTMHTWQRVMDLNARAFLLGAQMSAGLMSNGGRIVGLSSLGSHQCAPGYGALGSAKAALESVARYLAVELAPARINVNVVCGGLVDTDSTRLLPDFEALSQEVSARTPAGRIAKPEDIAGVVAFLCSPESDWMRGQTLVVDGGYSLRL